MSDPDEGRNDPTEPSGPPLPPPLQPPTPRPSSWPATPSAQEGSGAWPPLPPPPGTPGTRPWPAGPPEVAQPHRPRTWLVAVVAFVVTVGAGSWLGFAFTSHPAAHPPAADRAPIKVVTPTTPSGGSTPSGTCDPQ